MIITNATSNLRAQDKSAAQTPAGTNAAPPSSQSSAIQSSDIYKTMSLAQLMDQDVTSVAREPEPYGQAPAAIDVITSDEIRRSGASSIPEALRLADNLDVAQINSHDWAISSRGFNTDLADKLLVMIDGRTVYTPLFGGVIWDEQDYLLADIDRIEVISGPGGTLWGANAVNGVINIETKSADETQGLYVDGGGGSELRDFGSARYGGTLASNIFYRVYAKYSDRGEEDLTDGNGASDSWQMGQTGFRMDDEAVADNHFTAQGDFYVGNENVPTGGDEHTGGGNVLGRWTHTFSDDSDMSLQTYYDQTHLADPIASDSLAGFVVEPAGVLTDDLDTYDLDFQHRFHLGEYNNITWGLGYRFTHEEDKGAPALFFDPATLDQNLYSGFAQDEIKLMKNVFFTLGTKIEHNDYTGFEFEPSGRLQWNATSNQMFWGAISRAVSTPTRVDEDEREPVGPPLSALLGPTLLTGNPNFESETLIAYELGYRAQLGQKVSTSLSAYFNQYNDIRSAYYDPPTPPHILPFPLMYENNLKGETWGFELSADYQILDWWRLHGGYNFLQENIYVKSGTKDVNGALNETADPENQIFLRSSMDLPYHTELDLAGRWIDQLTYNSSMAGVPATVPSYFEMDARLAWHVGKHWEFSIVGQNLLHNRHVEYISPSPTPEEQIARSVYGKIAFNF
ncbi:MAG TPA: TonB-dependent receptor [Candidatus Acidoferrum sp.]|nr:TonB-dependent receptor [Candidatus Acidoferrum sp.]